VSDVAIGSDALLGVKFYSAFLVERGVVTLRALHRASEWLLLRNNPEC